MIKQSIVGFDRFIDDYLNKLRTPSCLPRHMGELCGGCKKKSTKWREKKKRKIYYKIIICITLDSLCM